MLRGTRLLAALALLPAACGDLPRPFQGQPGATAQALAQPPPARLAVPVPAAALLPEAAGRTYALAVADALQAREVPAVAGAAQLGDWRLDLTAELHGGQVVPTYTVDDPKGASKGSTDGPPIDAAGWASGDPGVLHAAAAAAGPQIATLLTSIEAARRRSDPNSLLNRPPRVQVATVTGAPGDGNRALTAQLRHILPSFGDMVQDTPAGADFVVAGQVRATQGPNQTTRVEIQWIITDAAGHDLGKVVQLNDVPKGTLDGLWGDVAVVVAQQAASGVREVLEKQTGPRAPATAAAAKP